MTIWLELKSPSSCDAILDFEPCHIGARFTGEALTGLSYLPRDTPLTRNPDQRAKHLAHELEQYAQHPDHNFDLLFVPSGTAFQLRVWRALLAIPVGKPLSYGALATQLKTAPRAVGQACGSNPLPLVIPCHRVVAANGLGGFMHAASGAPLDIKAWLLRHERGDFAHGVIPLLNPDETTKRSTDEAPSHATRLSKSDNQVAGYKPASRQVAADLPLAGEG